MCLQSCCSCSGRFVLQEGTISPEMVLENNHCNSGLVFEQFNIASLCSIIDSFEMKSIEGGAI